MKKSDFNYNLPEELIAQTPAEPRDASRLLVLDKNTGAIAHRHFYDLPSLLNAGDLLVVNNSKVLPARLIGHKKHTDGICELLLLRELQKDEWECLAKPGKRLPVGAELVFGDGTLSARIEETYEDGNKRVAFFHDAQSLHQKLDQFGELPLPPYIRQKMSNNSDYQTVYAKQIGSAAAPTAGLHFTENLLAELNKAGVGIAELTLHVGLGTFRPVKEELVKNHLMHSEWYSVSSEAASAIRTARGKGGRVIAVGTTSCRTLESVAKKHSHIQAASGETDIFLYPGSVFHATDALLTNFHLPESTLIMLVSAFCGHQNTMDAYRVAVEEQYRFFSFGDAMLII